MVYLKKYKQFENLSSFKTVDEENNMNEGRKKVNKRLYSPDYFLSEKEALSYMTPTMLDELLEYILKWDKIKKSPYGQSWYNHEKEWNGYVDGKLRVSDHWNFFPIKRKI